MSRKLRIEYLGAMYHVMNRGDQREDIFRDDQDRQKFLTTLGEACVKTEWQVRAYCLKRNRPPACCACRCTGREQALARQGNRKEGYRQALSSWARGAVWRSERGR
jgi:hypothetical protein